MSSAINVPKFVEPSVPAPPHKSHTTKEPSESNPVVEEEPQKIEGGEKQQPLIDVTKIDKPQTSGVRGVPNQPSKHPIGSSPQAPAIASFKTNPVASPTPVMIPAGSINTICNYEGIKVQVE